MKNSFCFSLPLGLILNGKTYRKGKMHTATIGDEISIIERTDSTLNVRFRDILLLAQVIDDLDGLSPITSAMIEEMFEADFLYLQLLYKEINSSKHITAICPHCGKQTPIHLPMLYENMDLYKYKKQEPEKS